MQHKRWIYLCAGVLSLLLSGIVYAWSVLSTPIAAEFSLWSTTQLSLTFTILMITFCLGGLIRGLLANKVPARQFMWLSAVLFLIGFSLSAKTATPLTLYIGFGIICGLASGFSYNTVLATIGKWFPDKQGLSSGIMLMGFGISSFVIGKLYQRFTPAATGSWRKSFLVLGILSALIMLFCSFFMILPDKDLHISASSLKKKHYVSPVAMEASPTQMLLRPQFWFFYFWAIDLSASGLALVSQASGIVREVSTSMSASRIATVVGLISIFNGIGRIVLGALFDRFGRSKIMHLINTFYILCPILLVISLRLGNIPLLIAGFIFGGFAYGGVTCCIAAFISSYFGMKFYSVNLPIAVTDLILASFGSTIAAALYDTTHSFMSIYYLIIFTAILGILLSVGISIADRKAVKKQ